MSLVLLYGYMHNNHDCQQHILCSLRVSQLTTLSQTLLFFTSYFLVQIINVSHHVPFSYTITQSDDHLRKHLSDAIARYICILELLEAMRATLRFMYLYLPHLSLYPHSSPFILFTTSLLPPCSPPGAACGGTTGWRLERRRRWPH